MEPWEIKRDILLQELSVREVQLEARYADANCRADIFDRLQDCDTRCKPKPPTKPFLGPWPPADFSVRSDPPALPDFPEINFTVKTAPDMIKTRWEEFEQCAGPDLHTPLTAREKTRFLGLEFFRLSSVAKRANWDLEYMQSCTQVDISIYHELLSTIYKDLIPIPFDFLITPTQYGPYDGRDYILFAVGPNRYKLEACILRLLYVDDLDVCQEIQDIATSGVFFPSVEGRWVWPEPVITTPRQRKAQDFIQWVMHAARQTSTIEQGRCNYLKLSDGWNNIWFHFEDGTLSVSPLLTPSRFDDAGTTKAPIGLAHSFVSFAHQAGLELYSYMYELYDTAQAKFLAKEAAKKASADVNVELEEIGSKTAETGALHCESTIRESDQG